MTVIITALDFEQQWKINPFSNQKVSIYFKRFDKQTIFVRMRIFIRYLKWTFPLLHSHPFAHSYKTNNKRASIYLHGSFIWINWILRCWNCILKLFRGQYNLISNWILESVYYTFHVCSLWTITEFPSLHLSDNDEVCWTIWGNFVNNAGDIRVDDAGGGDELGYSRHIPNSVFDIGALWYNWYLDLPSKFLNFFNNVCFSPLSSQLSFPKGPGAWKTPS